MNARARGRRTSRRTRYFEEGMRDSREREKRDDPPGEYNGTLMRRCIQFAISRCRCGDVVCEFGGRQTRLNIYTAE